MALIDWVHDAGRVITPLRNKSYVLRKEVQKLKAGGDPDVVATAEQRASKAQSLANHLKTELEEATRQWESLDKELSETQETLPVPELEIEEDPFKILPEDSNVPMAAEQPFDNSPPPPEE
ncbi:hypothetical protein GW17_00038878 [Ensete ventricosum]|nr:hypothetical protein GW17_00038878 [Ensete ventricosum]RZR95183.1 hypothetical protein BHM03_00023993 [Ensete ventricosum]